MTQRWIITKPFSALILMYHKSNPPRLFATQKYCQIPYLLTHWYRDKMAAIWQTTVSYAFSYNNNNCQLPWQTTNNWVVGDHIYYTQQQVNYNKRHKHNIKTNTKTRQINTKKIQTQSRPILQNLYHIRQSYGDLTMFLPIIPLHTC